MNDVQSYRRPAPTYEPILVPGQPLYEHLLKNNQKKLKRLMKEEQERYVETHAPGFDEIYWQRVEEGQSLLNSLAKKSPDYAMLGLSNHEGRLVKKDVRNAYRRQARKLHPDVGGTDEAFQELHAAYRRVLVSVPKE